MSLTLISLYLFVGLGRNQGLAHLGGLCTVGAHLGGLSRWGARTRPPLFYTTHVPVGPLPFLIAASSATRWHSACERSGGPVSWLQRAQPPQPHLSHEFFMSHTKVSIIDGRSQGQAAARLSSQPCRSVPGWPRPPHPPLPSTLRPWEPGHLPCSR